MPKIQSEVYKIHSYLDLGAYAYFAYAILLILLLMVLAEVTYRMIDISGMRFEKRANG